MKNSNYWKERFQKLEDDQYRQTEEYYKDIEKQFKKAQFDLQADIEKWYWRLADNNDISYAAARKLLKADELEEFHWTVEDYIKYGKENAIDQRWMKQLENASARVHIQRLEAIKLQMQQHAEKLYAEYEGRTADFLKDTYTEQFYHTAFEVAKGTGIGSNFARINPDTIDTVLRKPWAQDGSNFSDRIWKNKDKLVNTLHTELAQCVIRGENPLEASRRVAKQMDVSLKQASTLVYTESAAIASSARQDCLKELDVERYEIVATIDSRTSNICQEMDGKVFDMKEYQVGLTAPPFHPNCRSCTCPYFDDEFTVGEERAARGEDGKTYYVPANMKYSEWKEKFVDKSGQSDIIRTSGAKEVIQVHTIGKLDRAIYNCITQDITTDEVIITDERIQHIKDRHPNDYERFCSFIPEIIKNPDYIIEANKPNTAMILKEVVSAGEKFQLVLRIATSTDNPDFKNSVITFLNINERTWRKYLRNKKVLYKKE